MDLLQICQATCVREVSSGHHVPGHAAPAGTRASRAVNATWTVWQVGHHCTQPNFIILKTISLNF